MNKIKYLALLSCGLSALSGSAAVSTVSLGTTAASFDLFLLSAPEGGEAALEIKNTKPTKGATNFNGILGIGENSNTRIQHGVFFGSNTEIYRHSTFNEFDNGSTLPPAATVYELGMSTDDVVNTANQEITDYIACLNEMTGTYLGDMDGPFTYQTMTAFTILDFDDIAMDQDDIVLNGRKGFNDTLVIRIANDAIFTGGSSVTLNNLDRRNVIWLTSDDSKFDLHRNETANFEGIIINPTIDDKSGKTIIGDVDFKGQVFAGSMKLGSGIDFEGANVPEPSGGLLLLSAFTGLLVRRRR